MILFIYISLMRIIHACGCRGLGDLVSGTSNIIRTIKEDSHIIFHFPPGFDYKTTVDTLMSEFVMPAGINVTHELDETWYTVRRHVALKKFGRETLDKDWFFFASGGSTYVPFKTAWQGNINGPVAVSPNNENTNPQYPYPGKWFPEKLNSLIMNLIDEKKYLYLGRPFSIRECIDKMAVSRYAIGVDGAWTHIANAMRVPYILVRNDFDAKMMKRMHRAHPSIQFIETYQTLEYLPL
jgi:hypothetical protein